MDRTRPVSRTLAAWVALAALAMDLSFPFVSVSFAGPSQCHCAANGRECQCPGGCCAGAAKPSANEKSCCSSKATKGASCCSAKAAPVKSCCSKTASSCCSAAKSGSTKRDSTAKAKRSPCENGPPSVAGHCGCGERPDTATSEAPPRLVPIRSSGRLFSLLTDRTPEFVSLYSAISREPESPPPKA